MKLKLRLVIRSVLIPFWWAQGIMLTANKEKARRYRLIQEFKYWTSKIC